VILFVSGEYPPDVGGVGDYTARLRSELANLDWPSRVLSRKQVGRWDARALPWLLRTAPRGGIVHIQFQAGAFDLLGDACLMPALVRLTRPRARVATTFHDTRPPYLFPRAGRRLRQQAVRFLARTSHAVIAADQRDLLETDGPSPRHHVVPIGSNVACAPPPDFSRLAFRSRLGLGPDTLAVVYFGLLNASKGLDMLLEAFERLCGRRPDSRLLLLGGGVGASDPTNRSTANRLWPRVERLGSRVVRPGWLAPTDLSAYLLSGDVAVLPYIDGASPRRGSLLACAEHGLPILSTLPAAPDVAPHIEAVAPDAAALAEAVLRIDADPAMAARLRQVSRELAARVSWPSIAATHVRIYERLLYSRK
jgi:glycosyltransferase involved in cell wall biosynthesis